MSKEKRLIAAMLSALQEADDRLSEVITDDPQAVMFRDTRRTVRKMIRRAQAAAE